MARSFLTKSGDQIPVSDTLGTYVDVPLPIGRYRFPDTTFVAGATKEVKLQYSDGINWLNSNGRISVKAGDQLLIKYPVLQRSGGSFPNLFNAVYIGSAVVLLTKIFQKFSFGSSSVDEGSNVYLINVQTDGELTFNFASEVDATIVSIDWGYYFEITKLSQKAPYIVANKGALVSSSDPGFVSIDVDSGKMIQNRSRFVDLTSKLSVVSDMVGKINIAGEAIRFWYKSGVYHLSFNFEVPTTIPASGLPRTDRPLFDIGQSMTQVIFDCYIDSQGTSSNATFKRSWVASGKVMMDSTLALEAAWYNCVAHWPEELVTSGGV
jgi:hypothetical protein